MVLQYYCYIITEAGPASVTLCALRTPHTTISITAAINFNGIHLFVL